MYNYFPSFVVGEREGLHVSIGNHLSIFHHTVPLWGGFNTLTHDKMTDDGLVLKKWQAIIWTNADLVLYVLK